MANTKLNRTAGSTGNRRTWTFSAWVKRSAVKGTADSKGGLFSTYTDSNNRLDFGIDANDRFFFKEKEGSGSTLIDFTSHRTFQDPAAFFHFVVAVDTTQSTEANRVKIYVNGEQITSWLDSTYPGVNRDTLMNVSGRTYIIGSTDGSSNYWNGVMSHVHFCDGTALAPTVFGSTDSVTGQWEINTSPSFTLGTNGFTILKDGNTITDQSSNSNDFSLGGGTLTKTEDNPSNVFATYNPLDNYFANSTFSNGNTTIVTNSGNTTYNTSTLGIPPTMKCYWEVKFNTVQSANGEVGIVNTPTTGSSAGAYRLYYQTYGISVNDGGAIWSANADTGITLGTLSTSDIVCFAWDGVNQALYVRKNGDAWINSGNPTSGASKTGAVKSFSGTSLTMFPAVGDQSGAHAVGTSTNFGNGYFQTSAVSSAGSNASGNGIFEYDTPTGYTALSTKGLNL